MADACQPHGLAPAVKAMITLAFDTLAHGEETTNRAPDRNEQTDGKNDHAEVGIHLQRS